MKIRVRRPGLLISLGMSGALVAMVMLLPGLASAAHPAPSECDQNVQFGIDAGSPFPPTADHDASGHAADSLVPRTVVASVGDVVCFDTSGVHQFAAYEAGTRPGDVNPNVLTAAPAPCPPVPLIDDTSGRIDFQTHPCFGPRTYGLDTTDLAPGRYLIICTFRPHFVEGDMYGWVIVQ